MYANNTDPEMNYSQVIKFITQLNPEFSSTDISLLLENTYYESGLDDYDIESIKPI